MFSTVRFTSFLLWNIIFCFTCLSVASVTAQNTKDVPKIQKVIDTIQNKYVDQVSVDALFRSFVDAVNEELVNNKIVSRELRYLTVTSNTEENIKQFDKIIDALIASDMKITKETLVESGLKRMASSLKDDGTRYYPPGKYHLRKVLPSNKGRTGLFVDEEKDQNGRFIIVETLADSPADKARLKSGDRILNVDGVEVKDLEFHQLAEMVVGDVGTKLNISVELRNIREPMDLVLGRLEINPNPGSIVFKVIDKTIGYIKFKLLGYKLEVETENILKTFKDEGVSALIIDLRNNAGYLQAAVSVSGIFLPKETPIATEIFRNSARDYVAKKALLYDFPAIVLVNEYSSSASTIMAGALKIAGKARILGSPSRWKYDLGEKVEFADGSVLTVTSCYYKLANGKILRNKCEGVKPDILVPQNPFDCGFDSPGDKQLAKAKELLLETLKSKQ